MLLLTTALCPHVPGLCSPGSRYCRLQPHHSSAQIPPPAQSRDSVLQFCITLGLHPADTSLRVMNVPGPPGQQRKWQLNPVKARLSADRGMCHHSKPGPPLPRALGNSVQSPSALPQAAVVSCSWAAGHKGRDAGAPQGVSFPILGQRNQDRRPGEGQVHGGPEAQTSGLALNAPSGLLRCKWRWCSLETRLPCRDLGVQQALQGGLCEAPAQLFFAGQKGRLLCFRNRCVSKGLSAHRN